LLDNLLLFPTVKEFSKLLTIDEVIAKSSTPRFFLRHSVFQMSIFNTEMLFVFFLFRIHIL